MELYLLNHLKVASRVTKLLTHVINQANEEGSTTATITIHCSLLPESYTTVPAMLAKVLAPHIKYLHVRCVTRGEDIVISASDDPEPSSFRAHVLRALNEDGRIRIDRKLVPGSYRARPSLLTRSMWREFPYKIATIAKKKFIVWKLTTKER